MIQHTSIRSGTTDEWAATTLVLGDGEAGLDRDLGVLKVGNGTDVWEDLPGGVDLDSAGGSGVAFRDVSTATGTYEASEAAGLSHNFATDGDLDYTPAIADQYQPEHLTIDGSSWTFAESGLYLADLSLTGVTDYRLIVYTDAWVMPAPASSTPGIADAIVGPFLGQQGATVQFLVSQPDNTGTVTYASLTLVRYL